MAGPWAHGLMGPCGGTRRGGATMNMIQGKINVLIRIQDSITRTLNRTLI